MAEINFVLNGTQHTLSSDTVESRLARVEPEAIREHAVQVGGTWYPVKQAFEVALGVPRKDFISHAARRHLAALGFDVRGDISSREGLSTSAREPERSRARVLEGDWHTEAEVQAHVVAHLVASGWRILSVANTATKEHGVDVIAARDGQTLGIEVKGFPSTRYADPRRAGEAKRTSPSTQAGHWYAQAILAAMRLRVREPQWKSVIGLPDFPRYRALYAETETPLAAAEIEIWWVKEDGSLIKPS